MHNLRWRIAQILELKWWQRYLRHRGPDRYLAEKADYWQRLLTAAAVAVPPGARVLDAGCGPAGIFIVLHENRDVTAVDPLLHRYAAALPHFDPDRYPGVDFVAGTLETFSPVRLFDYVFCMNAINHVGDWHTALSALSRCTSPGGILVLGVDVHRYGGLKRLFRLVPGDILHPHQHDRRDYRKALARHGWTATGELTFRAGRIFDYWIVTGKKEN
jgi:SAM-dependent methyltransferase